MISRSENNAVVPADDSAIEESLQWLFDNAGAIGLARERLIRAEHMVKHIKAIEMRRNALLPISAQDREAVASNAFKLAIEEEAFAAGEFEKAKGMREAHLMRIEVWRTMNANMRALKL